MRTCTISPIPAPSSSPAILRRAAHSRSPSAFRCHDDRPLVPRGPVRRRTAAGRLRRHQRAASAAGGGAARGEQHGQYAQHRAGGRAAVGDGGGARRHDADAGRRLGAGRRRDRAAGPRQRRGGGGSAHRVGAAADSAARQLRCHRLRGGGRLDRLRREPRRQLGLARELPDRCHLRSARRCLSAGNRLHPRQDLRAERESGELRSCGPELDHGGGSGDERRGRRGGLDSAHRRRQRRLRRGRRRRTALRAELREVRPG